MHFSAERGGTVMERLVTTARQALPLTSRRITAIPKRITGLYRLSIVSKKPFEVDIGGKVIDNARTLDVFHETPMFIDSLQNAAALDFFAHGDTVRMMRIHPIGRGLPLDFRITAYEELPERNELERTLKLGRIEAPLEYEGLLRHSFHGILDAVTSDPDMDGESITLMNSIPGAIALALTLGVGAFLLAPVITPILTGTAFLPVVACDPSRTYINGRLFKNLKDVKVKVTSGRIVGYAYP
jgi:hypothetical protein